MLKKDPFGLALVSLMAVVALLALSQLVTPSFTRANMQRFHFHLPYPAYAALQVIPSMYNYKNTYTADSLRGYINHHPTRLFYEPRSRNMLLRAGADTITLQSTYQGQSYSSTWLMSNNGQLKPLR